MKRDSDVQEALNYLEDIWGDYGRHKRAVNTVIKYIEELERKVNKNNNGTI